MKTVEMVKMGTKSLVAVLRDNLEVKEYVVCSYYDKNKPYGSQWCWGHYFGTLENATQYLKESVK